MRALGNIFNRPTTRRGFLGLAAGAALLPASAMAQARVYSTVTADVSGLRARGLGGPYVQLARNALQRALQEAFAGRVGVGGAPRLIARIDVIQLSPLAEGDDWGFSSSSDYLQGEGLVVQGRNVVLRLPQTVNLPSTASGAAWHQADSEQWRTVALCNAFAGWLARGL